MLLLARSGVNDIQDTPDPGRNHDKYLAYPDYPAYPRSRRVRRSRIRRYGRNLVVIDRRYPSSKTCSACGHRLQGGE
ncbi:MAG: zinc ribbon domain-containing protein [Streptosporangiaceae bacterium]